METNSTFCKSCSSPLSGPFCSACGQKLITERFTIKTMMGKLFANIFNLEKGLLFTIQQLLTVPEEVIGGYINGQTNKYYNPFRFFLIVISIQVLILLSFDIYDAQYEQVAEVYKKMGINQSEEQQAFMREWMKYVEKFLTIIPLFLIPFYGFISHKIYKIKKYYFAEHCIMSLYILGLSTFIGIFTSIIVAIFPSLVDYVMPIGFITLGYFFSNFYHRFFKSDWVESILYSFMTVLGGYILFIISLFLIMGVLAMIAILLILGFKKIFG